ncbi:uncharacterized protein VTP21DRAFT_7849 [Calcarisporiella thermophila]|uniref:uncharacterized protein n=1 Tax=Calcarisporiella thermophila TaxID=911321 RepID=UPI0037420E3F
MTIAATNLAVTTASSNSLAHARRRVMHLYRDWQRAATIIPSLYLLDMPSSSVRNKIREEFEKNRHVSDIKVIDVLIAKGRMEYQETMNLWKEKSHIMRYFSQEEAPPKPDTFLEKFYAGKD